MQRWCKERGSALIAAAITIPILLLIAVGIFEFGRAYQTWQVLTNAAREGARISVLPSANNATVETRVRQYMENGQFPQFAPASVGVNRTTTIDVNGTPTSASEITVDYPFSFIVLQPVARMVAPATNLGDALTMRATTVMRNESQ